MPNCKSSELGCSELVAAPGIDDNILIIDDDASAIQLMNHILLDMGNLRFATNGEDALRLVRETPPDLILLDADMPGMSGVKLFEALKLEPAVADVPKIFVTSHTEAGFEVSAFEMGAADFIAKPFRASVVKARVKTHLRLKHMADELRRIATIDSLTGVANRRKFDESLEREWRNTLRAGEAISLVLVDVDHFKLYNDRYGHPKADSCLRRLAQVLTGACLRPSDLLARCGGEEFMALLPQTAQAGAEHVARRMLEAVGDLRIPHHDSPTNPNVTVSVGIACYDETSACWVPAGADNRLRDDIHMRSAAIDLVRAADKALYSAKRAGRAQVKIMNIGDVDALESSHIGAPPPRETHRTPP